MEAYLGYVHPDTLLWWNLGWTGSDDDFYPMIGGPGHPIDPDNPDTYEVNPINGDTSAAGIISVNNGYLFDPVGDDGAPFSGDELQQLIVLAEQGTNELLALQQAALA